MYRDPRDVVASYLEPYWGARGTVLGCAKMIRYTYRQAERLADKVGPERFCTVKYEALVEDPERELARYGYERNSPDPGPIPWRCGYWAERIQQGALRRIGIFRPLLDERAVLARRDEPVEQRRAGRRAPGRHPDTFTAGSQCH